MPIPLFTFLGLESTEQMFTEISSNIQHQMTRVQPEYTLVLDSFLFTLDTIKQILDGRPHYIVDPFVKDSRCQIQAVMIWACVDRLRTTLYPRINEVIREAQDLATYWRDVNVNVNRNGNGSGNGNGNRNGNGNGNMEDKEETIRMMIEKLTIGHLSQVASAVCPTLESSECMCMLQEMMVFLILSCSRTENIKNFPSMTSSLHQSYYSKKRIVAKLRNQAKSLTDQFVETSLEDAHVPSTLPVTKYFKTFMIVDRFVKLHQVPVMHFIHRACSLHHNGHIVMMRRSSSSLAAPASLDNAAAVGISSSSTAITMQVCSYHLYVYVYVWYVCMNVYHSSRTSQITSWISPVLTIPT